MKKVLLGMSGGIDSSVSAILLQKQGFEVIGLTLNITKNKESKNIKKAVEILDIKHYEENVSDIFKKNVIDYFIESYKNARTPNPCIICNKKIKFKILMDKMKQYGCDYIATGHYAKVIKKNEKFFVGRGQDLAKEQSYFLFELSSDILSNVIFPLGDLRKEDVKKIAKDKSLDFYSDVKESQDICFIDKDYKDFLKNYIEPKKGLIKTLSGKVLGEHEGLFNYTIGQKKGLGLSYHESLSVLKLDADKNELIVGKEDEISVKEVSLDNYIVHDEEFFDAKTILDVKIRYRSNFFKAVAVIENNKMLVSFQENVFGITPGQGLVIYLNDIIIGGGWV